MTAAAQAQPPQNVHRATTVPPGAGAMATPATGSITLAAEHFAAATLYLLAGAVGLLWIAPELAIGNFASPYVAGVTHLFTLGWLTTTIFGALYQLLPVALAAPVRSRTLGHMSFWTFAPGTGLFACGVADNSVMLHHAGIGLVTTGIVLVLVNIGRSLRGSRARDVTWGAVVLALTFLTSTLVLGVILLHNLHTGFIAAARLRVLGAHLHVAIVGWALVMIIGVSHRLLPMFLLAHGADTRFTKLALISIGLGVPTLVVGLVTQIAAVSWLALALIELGVALFLRQAYEFYRVRVRKKIDVGMRFAGTALVFLALAAATAPAVLALGVAAPRLATEYVLTGLLGGIVLYVVGFFYKIVPLLAWTALFRGRMGKEKVPTVAELFSPRVALVQLAFMALGVGSLAAGIAAGRAPVAITGAWLFFAGVLLFLTQLARVARGGRVCRHFGGSA